MDKMVKKTYLEEIFRDLYVEYDCIIIALHHRYIDFTPFFTIFSQKFTKNPDLFQFFFNLTQTLISLGKSITTVAVEQVHIPRLMTHF